MAATKPRDHPRVSSQGFPFDDLVDVALQGPPQKTHKLVPQEDGTMVILAHLCPSAGFNVFWALVPRHIPPSMTQEYAG